MDCKSNNYLLDSNEIEVINEMKNILIDIICCQRFAICLNGSTVHLLLTDIESKIVES